MAKRTRHDQVRPDPRGVTQQSAAGVIVPAQFAVAYIPVLQGVFGTRAIGLLDGILIVIAGAAFCAVIEVEKQLRLRLGSAAMPADDAGPVPLSA